MSIIVTLHGALPLYPMSDKKWRKVLRRKRIQQEKILRDAYRLRQRFPHLSQGEALYEVYPRG